MLICHSLLFRDCAVKKPSSSSSSGPSWRNIRSKSSGALLQDLSSSGRGSLGTTCVLFVFASFFLVFHVCWNIFNIMNRRASLCAPSKLHFAFCRPGNLLKWKRSCCFYHVFKWIVKQTEPRPFTFSCCPLKLLPFNGATVMSASYLNNTVTSLLCRRHFRADGEPSAQALVVFTVGTLAHHLVNVSWLKLCVAHQQQRLQSRVY